MTDKIEFSARRQDGRRGQGRDDLGRGQARRHAHPPSLPRRPARLPARRQLPRLHGRDRAASGCWPPPASASRPPAWWSRPIPSARRSRARWCSSFWPATCARPMPAPTTSRISGNGRRRWELPAASRYASKFDGHEAAEFDITNPAIAVNLDACIACGACVRACREVQVNDVIGMADRGGHTIPVFDMHDPMGLSTCVTCGECVQACPTGALFEKTLMDKAGKTRAIQEVRQGRRHALPVLRRRLPDQRLRQGQQDRPGRRPQRLRQREPALREGPLRLRLCDVARAADQAADPPRRCAEVGRDRPARRRSADDLPRSHLGGGAGARRRAAW